MSRMALALIPTFVPISAAVGQEAAGPVTAEQALIHYRQVFKTTREQYPAVERAIRELHSYELPAIHAVAFDRVYEPYAAWIAAGSSGV